MDSYLDEKILTLTEQGFKLLPMDDSTRAAVKKMEQARAAWKAGAKERRRQAKVAYAQFVELVREMEEKNALARSRK